MGLGQFEGIDMFTPELLARKDVEMMEDDVCVKFEQADDLIPNVS
jgi:hypothetical protein